MLLLSDRQPISNKCLLVKEMIGDSLVDLFLLTCLSGVCALLCVCLDETVKDGERRRRESVLTGRWSLSSSPEVFHFTPHYTRLFSSACCLSFTALQHPLPLLRLPLFLSSLHDCLLCWLHVKCQVQSPLTGPLWRVRGCKTSKVMSPARSLPLPPLFSVLLLSAVVKLMLV